jgi:hypothetical protein
MWVDLTTPDAEEARDFYAEVCGWKVAETPVENYVDYTMVDPVTGEPIAGICHRQGPNEFIPPQWMVYFEVADLDKAIATAIRKGGDVIDGPRKMGKLRFVCLKDCQKAFFALVGP